LKAVKAPASNPLTTDPESQIPILHSRLQIDAAPEMRFIVIP